MMILVTGGSGSGKSAYAEDCVLMLSEKPRTYIATMIPYDEEGKKRVQRHRNMRAGKGFDTVECYTDLKNLKLENGGTVLLECMSNLVANEMFSEGGAGKDTVPEVLKGIETLRNQADHLVVVTNEIFSDGAVYDGDMLLYEEYLGRINQAMAAMADQVTEVVYGIPVYHKKGDVSL